MATKKTTTYNPEQIRLAEIFKALAHPARIAIMEYLLKKGACVCGDIVEELPLAQSTVSQHLKVLKKAGLVQGEAEGVHSCYCADSAYCCEAMAVVMRFWQKIPNCC